MSADLVWLIVRKNNSFLVKRNGIQLSSEPGNLSNLHSFAASGIANPKTIDVSPLPDKKTGVIVTLKKTRGVDSQPAATPSSVVLDHGARGNSLALKKIAQSYRGDLSKSPLASSPCEFWALYSVQERSPGSGQWTSTPYGDFERAAIIDLGDISFLIFSLWGTWGLPALARVTALLRAHKAPRVHKEKKGVRAAKKAGKK
ncbi:60S ribosomal protein L28 [Gonapodya sp. JEL0774]|nr:60S ribosomal protein L28 [Gonapodya sp. JEL0774]